MGKVWRVTAWTLAVLLLGAIALLMHSWYARPLSIDWLFSRVHLQDLLDDPERRSQHGLLPRWLDAAPARLTDRSPAAAERAQARAKRQLAHLRGFDCSVLDFERAQSCLLLRYLLEQRIEGERWRYHDFPVNQLFGVQNTLPGLLAQQPIRNLGDARDVLARLEALPANFAGLVEDLRERDRRGLQPPRFLVERVLAEMRGFISLPAEDHLLYRSFVERLDRLPPAQLPASARSQLLARAQAAVEQSVYPAWQALIAHFEAIRPRARDNHGAWSRPDGAAYYAHMVRLHTTLEITPEQAHRLGLDEVARLRAEIDPLLRAQGLAAGSVGARFVALAGRDDQRFSNDDDGRAAVLALVEAQAAEAQTKSAAHFTRMPQATLAVARVPPFRERSAPGAYYSAPAADGSSPGTFYVNLRNLDELPRFALRTLVHHEAVPGHHLQTVLAMERDDLPAFRRQLPFSAYAEGWALYAERLAMEIGLTDDPLDDLGRLQAELFRAARLVVDTGLHHYRWSREQAIAYLCEHTGLADTDCVAEVERYLVYPGQALSFKIGMQHLLDLRARARSTLGEGFDLAAFHAVVLDGGRLPLPLLQQRVEHWLQTATGVAGSR